MSQSKRLSQVEASFLFAHRANIERYERLLQTYLTDDERAFIERRLHEERKAMAQLTESAAA
jgi:hypothetical protein